MRSRDRIEVAGLTTALAAEPATQPQIDAALADQVDLAILVCRR